MTHDDSQALQKLYKKITTHDSTETNIAALIADLAKNYPEAAAVRPFPSTKR